MLSSPLGLPELLVSCGHSNFHTHVDGTKLWANLWFNANDGKCKKPRYIFRIA